MHPVSRQAGLLLLLAMPSIAGAQNPATTTTDSNRAADASTKAHTDRPRVQAVARTGTIKLDGVLDDAIWATAQAATNFTQQDPDEGKPASEQTEVRFVYDDDALYIGARMHGEKVRTRMVRRDQIREGDNLMFVFDTYHDHSGRTIFQVNPSGVKFDAGQASPSADASWDPVWDVATKIDDKGWTAEMRIPWAQLRFPKDSVQNWGVQIWRYIEHRNETDMWSFWGKKETGGPQHFGHIENIHVSQKHGGLELLPYMVGRAAYQESLQPGSPFHDDSDFGWRAGGDIKALLTSTLTLDATINPDFGQVEADPAVVNLSAFETFFSEKRPFFVSGGGIFGFGSFSCFYCSNVSSMSLFYSRRIGRSAQGFVSQPADYTQMPENTTILGAAKITGRTSSGLQIGLLNALTASEKAKAISPSGATFSEEVEPLSNYFVGRAKKTYKNGDYTFGAIGTSVVRKFDNPVLKSLLPGHAEAVGFDWNMGWKKRTFSFMGNFAVSDVVGDTATIRRLQRTSARYFQRPDREHGSNGLFTDLYDPTLTAMRGYGGYARLAKDAGSWMGEVQTNFRSPGFEVNDLAFNTRSDYLWFNANVAHAYTKPTKWYRRADWTVGTQRQFNYDGDLTDAQFHAWAGGQTLFNWWFTGSVQYRPEVYDDRLTRGGPVARRSSVTNMFYSIQTDSRKKVVFGLFPSWTWTKEGGHDFNVGGDIRFKPATNIEMTFSPYYDNNHSMAQFVNKFTDASATNFYGQRVVFAEIDQKTVQFNTRVSATFTPTLTLEVVLQPFVSTGDYTNFKEFVAPRTVEKRIYDAAQLTATRDASGQIVSYSLDPDRNPATANFTFTNPDFNSSSLRGNAVLRWEYRPGSTLFLVWQQQRSGFERYGDFDVSRDVDAIFKGRADNIFLVKVSYWLPR
jgi:hypothetical protein